MFNKIINHFLWLKLRIYESWIHQGNKAKFLNVFRGYFWYLKSKLYPQFIDVQVFQSMKFRCEPGTAHALSYFFKGTEYDNWHVMKFISRVLQRGDIFIDVGANIGLFTLLAASKVGENGKILSVEPIKQNLHYLYTNIKINNLQNVLVKEAALADKFQDINFSVEDVSSHAIEPGSEGQLIACITLDSLSDELADDHFVLTKIDTEGMEYSVLKGGVNLMKNSMLPVIIFEMNGQHSRYGVDILDFEKFLFENNYFYGFYDENLKVLTLDGKFYEDTIAVKKEFIGQFKIRCPDINVNIN